MGKRIIVTAGPTNERIDAVMKITNMATGSLGAKVAERLLENPEVERVFYIHNQMAKKPNYTAQDGRLTMVEVESTQDLLNTIRVLLRDRPNPIHAVIHSAAVGDYKGRYAARAEDIADEITRAVTAKFTGRERGTYSFEEIRDTVLNVMTNPNCVQDNRTKISSYEPNLMVMLDLTPKVISTIKTSSPDTMLIGFKLLENVSNNELFRVADRLRKKNQADYIIANDLARINGDNHWSMVIGEKGLVTECADKTEIAGVIEKLVFGETVEYRCYSDR